MALLDIKNLNFKYPKQPQKALTDINFAIPKGAFVVICGESGSGKTTLLRQLKREIAPFGEKSGEIFYKGQHLSELDARIAACEIGFVMQNPDNQIVTDKVWHELAFGLESMGLSTDVIRLRVAEMASFFGIQDWFFKKVTELSGGQKQMLNLASIMAMQPKVLILDEPTSQLDPIASSNFLETVKRINRQLAVTVLITEHRLEEVYPAADKVVLMAGGKIICEGDPAQVAHELSRGDSQHTMFAGLPASVRIYAKTGGAGQCPMTVRDGRVWLEQHFAPQKAKKAEKVQETRHLGDEVPAVDMREVWFRYGKNMPDVLKGVTLKAHYGQIYCILGGNGAGKSTALSVMSRLYRPLRGKISIDGKKIEDYKSGQLYTGLLGMLPQNPQALFVKDTVEEDLMEIAKDGGRKDAEERVQNVVKLLQIEPLYDRHPFDLSGGEQQKAAFAKVLLKVAENNIAR